MKLLCNGFVKMDFVFFYCILRDKQPKGGKSISLAKYDYTYFMLVY